MTARPYLARNGSIQSSTGTLYALPEAIDLRNDYMDRALISLDLGHLECADAHLRLARILRTEINLARQAKTGAA